jgi:hypothetical protein
MDILLGLRQIRPNSSYTMLSDTYESLIWEDENTTKPTLAEIEAGYNEYQAQHQAKQYQRDRKLAYPKIEEQLDMLWHAIDNGTLDKTSDFYTTLKQVKDDNPKPTE